jgi:acetyl-CoA carboxylase carboxyl transferase subunit beta
LSKIRDIFRAKPKYVTVRPKEVSQQPAKEKAPVPDGLWAKCPQCSVFIYRKDLERSLSVCEKCGFHFPVGARQRIAQLVDAPDGFEELDADLDAGNPLGFPEYEGKKERDRKKTNLEDAVVTGRAVVGGHPVILGVMDFGFMGGSMGSVVGERITLAFERAIAERLPVIVVAGSGGARMQEGIISLMQMQKTAAALERHSREGLLYICLLTNPTTAGVYGSFASQADINLAEPGATVGFAGRPVIEAATGKRVPPDLQKAETVYENGFIDMLVPRSELKDVLVRLLGLHGAPMVPLAEAQTAILAEPAKNDAAVGAADPQDPVDTTIASPPPKRRLRRRRES